MDSFEGDFGDVEVPRLHGRDVVSLVVLSNSYLDLTLDALRQSLDEVFPGRFLPPREQGSFIVEGEVEFYIQSDIPGAEGAFLLFTVPGPYTIFSDFADHIAEPSLRRLAEAQTCWLSVDLLHPLKTEIEAYRFIGRVLAHLAPADAAALVVPSRLTTIAFDDDVRRRLASDGSVFAQPHRE